MIAFVDEHRATLGASRSAGCCSSPHRRPARMWHSAASRQRARRDATLGVEIRRVLQANVEVCGAGKIWRQLCREGIEVARHTVERLMRWLGIESRHPRQGSQDHDQR